MHRKDLPAREGTEEGVTDEVEEDIARLNLGHNWLSVLWGLIIFFLWITDKFPWWIYIPIMGTEAALFCLLSILFYLAITRMPSIGGEG